MKRCLSTLLDYFDCKLRLLNRFYAILFTIDSWKHCVDKHKRLNTLIKIWQQKNITIPKEAFDVTDINVFADDIDTTKFFLAHGHGSLMTTVMPSRDHHEVADAFGLPRTLLNFIASQNKLYILGDAAMYIEQGYKNALMLPSTDVEMHMLQCSDEEMLNIQEQCRHILLNTHVACVSTSDSGIVAFVGDINTTRIKLMRTECQDVGSLFTLVGPFCVAFDGHKIYRSYNYIVAMNNKEFKCDHPISSRHIINMLLRVFNVNKSLAHLSTTEIKRQQNTVTHSFPVVNMQWPHNIQLVMLSKFGLELIDRFHAATTIYKKPGHHKGSYLTWTEY